MFTTMDPLCEQDLGRSPYAYCAGNPIRYIDPTGAYILENIGDNINYTLMCVFPEFDKDKALLNDYLSAKEAGVPVMMVEDLSDFTAALHDLGEIIGSSASAFTINSHGNSGFFNVGRTRVDSSTDVSPLKEYLSGKEIFIGACNTGVGAEGKFFTEHLSKSLDATVITSEHPLFSGYQYDGSDGLNYYSIPMKNQNGSTYLLSRSGENTTRIYNVKMHQSLGISWDYGLFSHSTRPYTLFNNISNLWKK